MAAAVCLVLVVAVVLAACGDEDPGETTTAAAPEAIPQPSEAELAAAGLAELPVAPQSERVDIEVPSFSNPTEITNPLFPISELDSAILSGEVEGKPFHTETTLLPETRFIEWAPGQVAETRVSQYMAFLDGRLQEAALDFYAQADDGSVWYFGEDVFDYNEAGFAVTNEGTWHAPVDGPIAMIMPGDPQVGDVHRAENFPGIAFEEVEITTVDKTVKGPIGPVPGAIVGRELHDDGSYSDKVFAPGYGEFFSAHRGDVEAMALALPADAVEGPPPAELEEMAGAAEGAIDGVLAEDWTAARNSAAAADRAWESYRSGEVPPRIEVEMTRALRELEAAVDARDEGAAGGAAIDVAQSVLDLKLRYLDPAEIDLARFELWARQVEVDAAAGDLDGVGSAVTVMEWVRDRFADAIERSELTSIDSHLVVLRESVVDGDVDAAAAEAERLRQALEGVELSS